MKKLCIVVPYREREAHLIEFIPYIQKTMEEQKISYTILVVEQEKGKAFNRAKLLNIGFDFAKHDHDYFCFHDVDMLPIESDYSYCENPTHLASRAEQFGWKLPYSTYFGGVTIFDKESFIKINGYSNLYFGWGAEDDDAYRRCKKMEIKTFRKNCSYRSLSHDRKIDNIEYQKNVSLLNLCESRIDSDGLNSLSYLITQVEEKTNYIKILVSL